MLVTREADYALRSVLEVARRGRVSVAEVAERQGISPTFLGKIVQSLAKAGILATRRGVGGGVFLLRPVETITLLQVIEAVQGPLGINVCLMTPPQCVRTSICPAFPILCRVQEAVQDLLSVTVSDLLETDIGPPVTPAMAPAMARAAAAAPVAPVVTPAADGEPALGAGLAPVWSTPPAVPAVDGPELTPWECPSGGEDG